MRIVTAREMESWLATGKVLETDSRGPKVVALNDGSFLKIFHTRRHPVLARLQPAAKRFAQNAELLHKLGIAAPTVIDQFWIDPGQGLTGCLYQPIPGISIEALLRQSPQQVTTLLPQLAAFLRLLHDRRLYFRSLHIGNIVLLPNGKLGLIDFLDLKRNRLPLRAWHIQRNLHHLTSHLARRKLKEFPIEELIHLYNNIGNKHGFACTKEKFR